MELCGLKYYRYSEEMVEFPGKQGYRSQAFVLLGNMIKTYATALQLGGLGGKQ